MRLTPTRPGGKNNNKNKQKNKQTTQHTKHTLAGKPVALKKFGASGFKNYNLW
jgi:hypothetical protein